MSKKTMTTRWGICGAGMICHDFTEAVKLLSPEKHKVVSIAARDLTRAQEFAKQRGVQKAHGSYEELAKDPDVDVVYIGTIHPCHVEVGKMMLNAGKHVLCEKPLTMNLKQSQELVALAKQKNLFLMEGIWSRFYPAYDRLRAEIAAGTIGDPVHVVAQLSRNITWMKRVTDRSQGGGGLLTLGMYTIQFAMWVFGEAPEEVKAVGTLSPEGCDTGVSMSLKFSKNRLATLSTNVLFDGDNSATVYGTKGKISFPRLIHCPTELVLPNETIQYPLPDSDYKHRYVNWQGFSYEADCVRECINRGETECKKMPHKDSLALAAIVDEIRRQVGIVYDCDQ